MNRQEGKENRKSVEGRNRGERTKEEEEEDKEVIEMCRYIAKSVGSDQVECDGRDSRKKKTRVNGLLFPIRETNEIRNGHCCYAVARYTKRMRRRMIVVKMVANTNPFVRVTDPVEVM